MHIVDQQKHIYYKQKALLLIQNSLKCRRIMQPYINKTLWHTYLQISQIPWRIYKLQRRSL